MVEYSVVPTVACSVEKMVGLSVLLQVVKSDVLKAVWMVSPLEVYLA